MRIPLYLSGILLVLLFVACDGAEPRASLDGSLPDAEIESCVDGLPETLELSEGGRAEIVVPVGTRVSGTEGLEAWVEVERAVVYAGYEVDTAQELTIAPPGCADARVEVSVRPLEWTRLAEWDPAESGPPAREYGAFAPLTLDGESGLLVYGGFHYFPRQFTPAHDLWFFDLARGHWRALSDETGPLSPGGRFAPGPTPGTLLLHGGAEIAADGSLDTPPSLHVLRYADGSFDWEDAPFESGAPGSYTGAFVHDVSRERWLSICGADSSLYGVHCHVLAYRPESGWERLEIDGTPPPGRYGFHYAYDEASERVVVVAGQGAREEIFGDTWALDLSVDPPRWERLFDETPEVRRRNGAYALDPEGRRLFVWGGTADGRTAVPGISVLRLEPGHERWDHLETPPEVSPRASALAVYDAESQRLVLGFGNADRVYTDLFALAL